MTAIHATGGPTRPTSRVRLLRNRYADSRRRTDRWVRSVRSTSVMLATLPRFELVLRGMPASRQLRRVLQAFVHSEYGTHLVSDRPSRQSDCGVAQNQIFLKYGSSSAWKTLQ